jgi:cytidine deaminase
MISEKKLIQKALKAKERAYAPYSNFRVGASILSDDKIYVGFNIENISYSLTICAERVAVINALLNGAKNFEKIVITSDSEEFPYPCGACLQFISEFAKNMDIILINGEGRTKSTKFKELFPKPFKRKNLKNSI